MADEKPTALVPEVVPEKKVGTLRSDAQAAILQIEDRLLEKNVRIIEAISDAPEVEGPDPPPEWIEKYGPKEAKRRHRIACHALLNSKQAPVYLDHATKVATGIMKARASRQEAAGGPAINIQVVVNGDVNVTAYPTQKVDPE